MGEISGSKRRDFSLTLEMTAGAGSWLLPCREQNNEISRFARNDKKLNEMMGYNVPFGPGHKQPWYSAGDSSTKKEV